MTDAIESSMQEELYKIEEGFWLGSKEHFLGYVDEQCLLAFPQAAERHGIRSREARPPRRIGFNGRLA